MTSVCAGLPRTGFLKSIQVILKLKEGGLATAGPPCGSFVFLNMATSKRTRSKPLGGRWEYVKRANQILVFKVPQVLQNVFGWDDLLKSWVAWDSQVLICPSSIPQRSAKCVTVTCSSQLQLLFIQRVRPWITPSHDGGQ